MRLLLSLLLATFTFSILAQPGQKKTGPFSDQNFKGLEFRSIGPAFASGRIADIAIHPDDDNTWYVAAGSGGVWKTVNAGVTWTPLFDGQSCYSIGCISIDPNNPNIIWVGTGENVGGRHVGYGDGIYRSDDGGKSWKNMGLKESEHISKIIIHPGNSDIIWAAAQGPLWNKDGQRGLFKSTDGGQNWELSLFINEWTGVTDIAIDPRQPDRIYAATWQRHRNVAAYMGGGPGSGIHRSLDGGATWEKLERGLPKSNMGKIGIAISPQKPDVLYAAIELDRRTGGIFKSTDRGSSWEKQGSAVAGATGPHYYQELYASPHAFDRIYLVDVRIQISDDGGKTVRRLKEKNKHSDNHAIAFRMDDPDYLLVGTDGGIYETFDGAENWRFMNNLPLTQYYKVAVDDAEPFYNILGGTQDVNTHFGPSRTDNVHGIRNGDWRITLFGDGHQPATEPGNPGIVYSEWQQGNLCRIDQATGEIVYIKPQPEAGAPRDRFNWDSPILVSPHSPTRLYFASQRVWRSDDRGDSWTAISGDLTKNQERFDLPIMGKKQSWDNAWDVLAMSDFNTITSLAESPKQAGLIYAGTDDGRIQTTEDGGKNWRKTEVGSLPGAPATAFVNDIKADLFDANTVYAVLDNHKYGDLQPYLFKSTDRGKSWKSIRSNLPGRTLVWRIVQDHVKPGLLFAATEFGIYFTIDGGGKWTKLTGGVPTISFRDLAIQRRENDLVGASFGRGFYVLDDYAVLREISPGQMEEEATLFGTRKAWWYVPRPGVGFEGKGNQGAGYFTAPNPAFGATFTYYLKEALSSLKSERKKSEKEKTDGTDFPGWEKLDAEMNQSEPKIWLTVTGADGQYVRRIEGKTGQGFHRVSWDLRYPSPRVVPLEKPKGDGEGNRGFMAPPGTYTVTLSKWVDGVETQLSAPQKFEVVPLRKGQLTTAAPSEVAAFWREIEAFQNRLSVLTDKMRKAKKRAAAMQISLDRAKVPSGNALNFMAHEIRRELNAIDGELYGSPAKRSIGEPTDPTIQSRLGHVTTGNGRSTYGPTPAHRRSLEIAISEFNELEKRFEKVMGEMGSLEEELERVGAPGVGG